MALEKRISELTAKTGALEDTDLILISDYNGVDYDTKSVTGAQIKPYKTLLLNISQSGTSAPTINSSYSELTSNFYCQRNTNGNYYIQLSSLEFLDNKTFIQVTLGGSASLTNMYAIKVTEDRINFYSSNSNTGTLTDGLLNEAQIEIKIIK